MVCPTVAWKHTTHIHRCATCTLCCIDKDSCSLLECDTYGQTDKTFFKRAFTVIQQETVPSKQGRNVTIAVSLPLLHNSLIEKGVFILPACVDSNIGKSTRGETCKACFLMNSEDDNTPSVSFTVWPGRSMPNLCSQKK